MVISLFTFVIVNEKIKINTQHVKLDLKIIFFFLKKEVTPQRCNRRNLYRSNNSARMYEKPRICFRTSPIKPLFFFSESFSKRILQ